MCKCFWWEPSRVTLDTAQIYLLRLDSLIFPFQKSNSEEALIFFASLLRYLFLQALLFKFSCQPLQSNKYSLLSFSLFTSHCYWSKCQNGILNNVTGGQIVILLLHWPKALLLKHLIKIFCTIAAFKKFILIYAGTYFSFIFFISSMSFLKCKLRSIDCQYIGFFL